MPWGFRRRGEPEPAAPGAAPAAATGPDELTALRTSLRSTVARVNRSAGRLPEGVVPRVRAIEDLLVELLDHEATTAWSTLTAQTRFSLSATVDDYLPTSISAYLALPPDFAATHRSAEGRSPAEELQEQLRTLYVAVQELAQAVYAGDAERLSTQGRFLDTKFSRSDLDLEAGGRR